MNLFNSNPKLKHPIKEIDVKFWKWISGKHVSINRLFHPSQSLKIKWYAFENIFSSLYNMSVCKSKPVNSIEKTCSHLQNRLSKISNHKIFIGWHSLKLNTKVGKIDNG